MEGTVCRYSFFIFVVRAGFIFLIHFYTLKDSVLSGCFLYPCYGSPSLFSFAFLCFCKIWTLLSFFSTLIFRFHFLIFYLFHEKYFSSCIYKVFEITYVLDYMEILLTFDIGWHLQDGNEVFFRIKRSTQLRKLMNAYCDRQSIDFNSIAFLFDGRRLRGEQTPDEVCFFDLYSYFPSRYNIGGVKNSSFVHCVSKLIFWCMLLMAIA